MKRNLLLLLATLVGVSALQVTQMALPAQVAEQTNASEVVAVPSPQPADGSLEAARVTPLTQNGPISTRNLLSIFGEAGPLMLPIVFCSFLLTVFALERSVSLRRGRIIPRPFVKRFLEQLEEDQLDQQEALRRCQENKSPVAEVFAAAIKKWGRPSVEVEQAILDAGERTSNGLRRYLRLFSGISTISPLLGLLGTVVGMMSAFNAIATADAMGRPEMLAAGISQALLTTAAGLSVAIPAFIAYLFFVSRIDRLVMDIDALGQRVVNATASDGWKEDSPLQSKARTTSRTKKKAA